MQWMCVIAVLVCCSVDAIIRRVTYTYMRTHQAQYSSFDIVLCALSSAVVTTMALYRDERMKMSSRRNFLFSSNEC